MRYVQTAAAAAGTEEGTNLYDTPRASSGTGTATRSEEMDVMVETETQTEPRMGGIRTDMRGVGAETETRSRKDELSARCVDRVLEMRSGRGRGRGRG
jgi:hypothetical protein